MRCENGKRIKRADATSAVLEGYGATSGQFTKMSILKSMVQDWKGFSTGFKCGLTANAVLKQMAPDLRESNTARLHAAARFSAGG